MDAQVSPPGDPSRLENNDKIVRVIDAGNKWRVLDTLKTKAQYGVRHRFLCPMSVVSLD